jgi:predicted ATP-grasp superfamily ATP-dependent carboligase
MKFNNFPSKSAIVSDGMWRKSLSVVRSLGKKDINVSVMGSSFLTVSFWSRFTTKRIYSSSAENNYDKFGQKLMVLLEGDSSTNKPVLFPMEDATLNWASKNKKFVDQYSHCLIPDYESLVIAQDKFKTLNLAISCNIQTPKTIQAKTLFEFKKIVGDSIRDKTIKDFLIKPVSGSGSSGVVYGNDIEKCNLDLYWNKHNPILFQELIPKNGKAVGVSMLINRKGKVCAHFIHERLHQFPVSGGPSTDRIGIKNEFLLKKSTELLNKLNWKGVAMVEWKYDHNCDEFKLLEINPRFWGSLELAIRSGVDFPYLYFRAAQGLSSDNNDYSTNIRCRWLLGDILNFINSRGVNKNRNMKSFFIGLIKNSEEWDPADIPGFFSSIICSLINLFNPKYWKYLTSKRP